MKWIKEHPEVWAYVLLVVWFIFLALLIRRDDIRQDSCEARGGNLVYHGVCGKFTEIKK